MLRDYVEAHLDAGLGVDELAALADIPVLSFGRVFKATFGQSPHRYVTTRRLARACELLRDPDTALVDVAAATGFCDQSHMTRAFKTHLGVTPGAWRATLAR
jgi:AraC family transcriptional regulator